ncbi:GNAT family N-acetyltransferase [Streptomyces asoensis]|uniref:GNAT family N-acetyltransferase n=1 Tax=Streptomyces asoensis TaxID=249586 RepID=UPI0033DDDDA3
MNRRATPQPLDVRPVTDAELADWTRAVNTGFLRPPTVPDRMLADRRVAFAGSRVSGAFDGGRCVATFRSFAQELTAVGGAAVPADGISNVTVAPTHRRRGLLTRLMADDLAAAKERGDVVATLIAAEYRIYGRYGFGPATTMTEWSIDVPRAGLDPRWAGPLDGGRIDFADGEEIRRLGPQLHERLRRERAGVIDRNEHWWAARTGRLWLYGDAWVEPFFVVYRSADGVVEGMASYRTDEKWSDAKQPLNTAAVNWLTAVTPAAERALWHYLCSIDWIATVRTGWRAPDDLLPLHLPDPRAASITTQADWLWVRVLDVVRALEARTYAASGVSVLEVVDRAGLAGGRFLLDATPDGASCAPTTRDADLTLDVADLATLWLGDETVGRLVSLGRVREERAGAAREADALLRTSGRPWCPDMF